MVQLTLLVFALFFSYLKLSPRSCKSEEESHMNAHMNKRSWRKRKWKWMRLNRLLWCSRKEGNENGNDILCNTTFVRICGDSLLFCNYQRTWQANRRDTCRGKAPKQANWHSGEAWTTPPIGRTPWQGMQWRKRFVQRLVTFGGHENEKNI
mgnify:CR=1 FL=1